MDFLHFLWKKFLDHPKFFGGKVGTRTTNADLEQNIAPTDVSYPRPLPGNIFLFRIIFHFLIKLFYKSFFGILVIFPY